MDYRPVDTVLSFSESVTTIPVNVTLIDDNYLENTETLQVRFEIITQGASIEFFSAQTAPVTILDDDSKQFSCSLGFWLLYA